METESAVDSLMDLSSGNQQDSGSCKTLPPLPQRKRKKMMFAEEESLLPDYYNKLKKDMEHMTAMCDSLKQATSEMVSAAVHARVVEEIGMLQASLSSLKEFYKNPVRARSCNKNCPAQEMEIAKLENLFKTHTLVNKASLDQLI